MILEEEFNLNGLVAKKKFLVVKFEWYNYTVLR